MSPFVISPDFLFLPRIGASDKVFSGRIALRSMAGNAIAINKITSPSGFEVKQLNIGSSENCIFDIILLNHSIDPGEYNIVFILKDGFNKNIDARLKIIIGK